MRIIKKTNAVSGEIAGDLVLTNGNLIIEDKTKGLVLTDANDDEHTVTVTSEPALEISE
jgi:hypothetical protein